MTNDTVHQEQETDSTGSNLFLTLGLVSAMGFSSHRLRPSIQKLGPAWSELVSYVVGVGMIVIIFPLLHSLVLESTGTVAGRSKNVFLAVLSLILAAGSIGSGVAFGWLVDPGESE